ncbi:MAG: hypothetical protein A2063_07495 [Gallionellales bacterium GWA2_60_142]|nr:MAG: hypothetical protein A2063_07495 [Gallionellales bacterium GWA2_60_142]HCI13601.1 hypothetical protein [Gallionellaceae bacterium]
MTTPTDVKTLLRALNPTEVISEGDDFVVTIGSTAIKIIGADVDAYLTAKPSLAHTSDTSLSAPGYQEQVVDIQGRGPLSWRLFRESEELSLKHPNNGFEITVGPVSTNLVFSLTDSDAIAKDLRRAVMMRRNPYREKENLNLRDLFSRIISVKIRAPSGHALFNNSRQLRALAEASLYHIAFGYGVSIIPIQSWERSFYSLETRKKEVVQFPLRTYNSELVAYYQLALGAESLILSYLALYKILEYFFTSAAEHVLFDRVKEQLVAPDFSHLKTGKLRELTKTIWRFDQKMDERKRVSPECCAKQSICPQYIMTAKVKGCRMSAHRLRRGQDTTERSGLTSGNRSKEETA